MQPVFGNYLGIVLFNNDPEQRERVQVFIPHLSCTIYKDWNEALTDQVVKNPSSLPSTVLEKLQKILPWAEVCKPSFGGGTAGIQNPHTGGTGVAGNLGNAIMPQSPPAVDSLETTPGTIPPDSYYDNLPGVTSNANNPPTLPYGQASTDAATPYNESVDPTQVTQAPAQALGTTPTGDLYKSPPLTAVMSGNTLDYNLANTIGDPAPQPTDPTAPATVLVNPSLDIAGIASQVANILGSTGGPSGAFSTPNPGAKVWVFFYGGDIQKPVYFGVANDPSGSASVSNG